MNLLTVQAKCFFYNMIITLQASSEGKTAPPV